MLVQENIETHITMVAGVLNLEAMKCWSWGIILPNHFEPNQPPQILTTSSFPLGFDRRTEVKSMNGTQLSFPFYFMFRWR